MSNIPNCIANIFATFLQALNIRLIILMHRVQLQCFSCFHFLDEVLPSEHPGPVFPLGQIGTQDTSIIL